MNNAKLSSDDLEQIKNIERTCLWIESIYNKLFFLDRTGKKETEEYKKLLEELKNATEIEKMQYNMANFSPLKASLLMDHLGLSSSNVKDIEEAISLNFGNRTKKRIYNCLHNITLSSPDIASRDMLTSGFKEVLDLNPKMAKQLINYGVQIILSLEKDLTSGFLMFVQESVNKNININVKNRLIESIYYLSFVNQDLEQDMICSSFCIDDILYVGGRLKANMLTIDSTIYDLETGEFLGQVLLSEILKLFDITDGQYRSDSIVASSILSQCLIRTALVLNINEANYYKKEIISILKTLENSGKFIYRTKSRDLVLSCFDMIEEDRNKVRYISLGNR